MPVKVKSIDHTMIPIDYTEMSHEEWRVYIHDQLSPTSRMELLVEEARRIVKTENPRLTPEQKAKGDFVIYMLMITAAIGIALIYSLK